MTAKIVTTIMPPRIVTTIMPPRIIPTIVTTIMPPRIIPTIYYPEPADPDQEIDVSNFYGDVSWSDEEQQDDDDTPRHTRLDSLGMPMPDSDSDSASASDSDSASDYVSDSDYDSDFISDSNFMDEDGNIDEYAKKMYYEYLTQYNEYLNKNIELEDEYWARQEEGPNEDVTEVDTSPEAIEKYYADLQKEYSDELNAHYEEIPV
jgi:hypothetical protein